ncbi:DUF3040 domain-containing protein [Modestobacter sp. NPDC049651]|uniref:DUF3040 domain-containing protein n=1 Tax=unclassified Modestobacter TaxID=2643866 RepID=UPI0033F8F8FF
MPLSEHEQRLLEQIERSLVDEDPKFASAVRSGSRRSKARRRFQLGVVLIPIGLAGMVGGVAVPSVVLGVIGALVMFAGGALAVLNFKTGTSNAPEAAAPGARPAGGRRGAGPKGPKARKQPLKNRLEERFRRRYDQ